MAVYRPVVALTVTLALLMFGVVSYFSLGLENNPELKLPIVTVTAVYPGASARAVEEQVSRKIEDAVTGHGNIKTITSPRQHAGAGGDKPRPYMTMRPEYTIGRDRDGAGRLTGTSLPGPPSRRRPGR